VGQKYGQEAVGRRKILDFPGIELISINPYPKHLTYKELSFFLVELTV
jgi:hypothetical protein